MKNFKISNISKDLHSLLIFEYAVPALENKSNFEKLHCLLIKKRTKIKEANCVDDYLMKASSVALRAPFPPLVGNHLTNRHIVPEVRTSVVDYLFVPSTTAVKFSVLFLYRRIFSIHVLFKRCTIALWCDFYLLMSHKFV
jgi:formyltetrahydrofolate hydrolase